MCLTTDREANGGKEEKKKIIYVRFIEAFHSYKIDTSGLYSRIFAHALALVYIRVQCIHESSQSHAVAYTA